MINEYEKYQFSFLKKKNTKSVNVTYLNYKSLSVISKWIQTFLGYVKKII